MLRIGYACSNTALPSASRTCRLKNATPERLLQLSRQNLRALGRILRWNVERGIFLFRISSETIPFGSHPVNALPWWQLLKPELERLGDTVRQAGLRVSMHPGQYTVLNSPRREVVRNAVADLLYHGRFMDAMGLDAAHKIVVHAGGAYGDKAAAADRFLRKCAALPPAVKRRLAVENDEKTYSAAEVLQLAKRLKIPMVFDLFHHQCLTSFEGLALDQIIAAVAATWRPIDGPPKIHYSNQHQAKPSGAHSETLDVDRFRLLWHAVGRLNLDIMLEVKDKQQSVLNIYQKIPALRPR